HLALLMTAVLLSGCQWPGFGGAPAGGLRMVARAETDTLAGLRGLPPDEAYALQTLTPEGYQGWRMQDATFKLDVADYEPGAEEKVKDALFADYLTALSRAQAAGADRVLPSVNLIDGVTKQINDGLYARLELLLEQSQKAELRRQLYAAFQSELDARPADPEWRALVARAAASLKLAGEPVALEGELSAAQEAALKAFSADALRSKPIGFYTWRDPLRTIFQADRMLQSRVPLELERVPLDPALREAALAGQAMAARPALSEAYDRVIRFYERMTNPLMGFSPTAIAKAKPAELTWEALAADPAARRTLYDRLKANRAPGIEMEFSLLPPSRSTEVMLLSQDPPPDGDLMAHLIRRVREGRVSLAPQADSGFYQYQQHALEALLTPDKNPEGAKITFGEKYLKRLEEAFKTGLAKARETHAKQIGWGIGPTSAPPPPAKPRLFVEPIVTVYKRYGDMYAFLEKSVLPLFPADTLASARPLTASGEGDRPIPDEIAAAKRLMYGLYLIGAANIGLAPAADLALTADERDQALDEAKTWLLHYHQDARLAVDTRVAVPVTVEEASPGRKVIKFWGTAGVTLVKVQADFVRMPQGAQGEPEPAGYLVAADKFVAFERPYEKGVLNRDEYRKILDTSATFDEALRRLQGQ
ncbi:MAG: hypothetical protein ACK46X_12285, partial [Candidatus Sericytochromatia bacterium]